MKDRRISDISQERLLRWYAANHRRLPWRETRDPYRILVSEIMLQQTQVERVVPIYHAFIERFPTLHALADAPTSDVIRSWAGLGYNRRAVNLQRACQAVIERFGGAIPSNLDELLSLPGIGPYTAGAVSCFAFERDVGFVDTNIRRVIHRVLAGPELPDAIMSPREIETTAGCLVPEGRGYEWNQALMELGATLCRARVAACERCPLEQECRARPTIATVLATGPRFAGKPAPKFETTSRFVRGRIVDALRAAGPEGLTVRALGIAAKPTFASIDAAWIVDHVIGLERDGLVARVAERRTLNEAPEPYDSRSVGLDERFSLPD